MSQKLTMKKIDTWRQRLQEILWMEKKQGELVPKNQSKRLQELAQEMGASTRGVGYHSNGGPFGYDASIAELIDNINQTLQTATFIVNCKYARRACYTTLAAVIVAILASIISISAARKANKITLASLQNSYTPWLQVTSVKVLPLDINHVEIVHGCQNYTNAPALDIYIKYTILNGVSMVSESPTYVSNPLMPNYEGRFNCIFTTLNQDQTGRLLEKLDSGECSIRFDIYFKDVFDHNIVVHQETKRIDGKFRITKYEVDGIDNLFEEIE